MNRCCAKKSTVTLQRLALTAFVTLFLAACGEEPAPTATPPPTATAIPTPTPAAAATPAPVSLTILSPREGAGVETGAVRVLGKTRNDAVVAINGTPVDVAADGSFEQDLVVEEGINSIEVVATDLFGHTAFTPVVFFSISPTAGLPFSLFYPADGLEVTDPTISVVGGTRPDAVVGVNGNPVDVNALGIFSATVSLEEGANLIEVVAADMHENLRFETAVVFYIP